MKKARKGFTLVELIIVLGIVSILGAMGMVSGSEVSNMANANKIIEDFKMISAAMNMYYADNKAACDKGVTATQIKTGLVNYMKSTDGLLDKTSVTANGGSDAGKYMIVVVGSEWWLKYTLTAKSTKLANILANKAAQEGLKSKTSTIDETSNAVTAPAATDLYKATGVEVCYQVR